MKKLYTLISALLIAQGMMATDYKQLQKSGKIDAFSKMELLGLQQQEEEAVSQAKAAGKATAKSLKSLQDKMESRSIHALVKMAPGAAPAQLEQDGFEVTSTTEHFATADITLRQLEQLLERNDVESVSFGERKKYLHLTKAHASTGVDKIHSGQDLEQPYTGKGVAIGILDSGFDPNHIMFQDADGKSRFREIIQWDQKEKEYIFYDTEEEIADFTTDNAKETHATHVAGMAAGSYKGSGYSIEGAAPEAELMMGFIPQYVQNYRQLAYMAEWCEKNGGKRLVANMSFGQSCGPHDGSDNEAQYLDELIKKYDIVACMSAGNEADEDIVQRHTFKGETSEQMKGAFYIADQDASTYFTVSDKEQIEIDLVLINQKTGKATKTYHFVNATYPDGRAQDYDNKDFQASVKVTSEDIANGMKGYLLDIAGFSSLKDGYTLGYIFRGKKGQTVTSYVEANMCSLDASIPGYADDITHDGTINASACGSELIVVGAYNTADSYRSLDGYTYSSAAKYGNKVNEISYFSSYGQLVDGRTLPTLCAPGFYVESSYNHHVTYPASADREHSYSIKNLTHQETADGASYPFGAMSGTSMASPYMAGVCALWLEADPTLSHTEIRDIAQKTAINDKYCNEDNYFTKIGEGNQAGAGKVDAYRGLKYILDQKTAILSPIAPGKDYMLRLVAPYTYEAYIAGANSMQAALYTIDGKRVAAASKAGNTVQISAQGHQKGVYVLRITDGKQTHAQKVVME